VLGRWGRSRASSDGWVVVAGGRKRAVEEAEQMLALYGPNKGVFMLVFKLIRE